jgi:hypothetical protein
MISFITFFYTMKMDGEITYEEFCRSKRCVEEHRDGGNPLMSDNPDILLSFVIYSIYVYEMAKKTQSISDILQTVIIHSHDSIMRVDRFCSICRYYMGLYCSYNLVPFEELRLRVLENRTFESSEIESRYRTVYFIDSILEFLSQ